MGRILQRTAISTNIKERLDFSCALFGPDGGLVSNAPHIPVHLGAMQSTVRYQMDQLGNGQLHKGDVILANHPQGSTYTIENIALLYYFTLFVLPMHSSKIINALDFFLQCNYNFTLFNGMQILLIFCGMHEAQQKRNYYI